NQDCDGKKGNATALANHGVSSLRGDFLRSSSDGTRGEGGLPKADVRAPWTASFGRIGIGRGNRSARAVLESRIRIASQTPPFLVSLSSVANCAICGTFVATAILKTITPGQPAMPAF